MSAIEAFLDSNILLYALSDDPAERCKQERAAEILRTVSFGISYQVLMETWVVATRKFEKPVAEEKVLQFLEQLVEFPCVEASVGLFRQAAVLRRQYGIHPYDAAIVAAAVNLGAPVLYSEDFSHGQIYSGVKVVNPFLAQSSLETRAAR